MSSSTINSDTTPDGAAESQKARPRRRRAPRSHDAATATTPVAEQASAPAPAIPEAPAAETALLAGATDDAQRARAAGTGRSRRGRGRGEGRKSAVQLIVPPTHGAEGAAGDETAEQTAATEPAAQETPSTQETAPVATTEARVVPVTTEATPAATTEALPAEAAPARSRYRFAPRTPVVTAAPLVRPERLSNGATSANAAEEPQPAPATTATPATDADEGEDWHASVAEVAPSDVARSAAEAQDQTSSVPQASDERAVDDLMSALGLHERQAAGQATAETLAGVATDASPEGENSAAEETTEAEGQNGTRRRRRRRRGSSHAAAGADDLEDDHAPTDTLATAPSLQDEEIEGERNARNGFEPYSPYGTLDQPYSPYTRAPRERAPQPSAWDVSASQQQYGQSSPYSYPQSAYGSPEPSFARGFGPQSRGVAGPPREPLVRPARTERGTDAPISSSQLAQIVSSAIQQQTDRLLAELRHQQPPSMMLQLPAMPSTERIGVFVDVANLFYSARSMRMSLDFGRMLDFLRANRRLVRAHAYAPTSPDASADQSFLNAVKGMGYRITTKNYKTFSSGAKKADMDLDLCMDIVRFVDAGAVDTIVLVSGDSDFLPLLEYCSDHGVRVEVAAFDDAAAMILRQSCDLFINLSLVDEIRA